MKNNNAVDLEESRFYLVILEIHLQNCIWILITSFTRIDTSNNLDQSPYLILGTYTEPACEQHQPFHSERMFVLGIQDNGDKNVNIVVCYIHDAVVSV